MASQEKSGSEAIKLPSADGCPVNHSAPPAAPLPPTGQLDACPVDHKTREAWIKNNSSGSNNPHAQPPQTSVLSSPLPSTSTPSLVPSQTPPSASAEPADDPEALGKLRQVSSIPRANVFSSYNGGEGNNSGNPHGGAVSGSSKWVYPSEEMFYNAMKRKNWDPKAADMRVVVPIHNAVNERAWAEILKWESLAGTNTCGGPKLVSFSGDASNLSPRARINTLLGYQSPFDRHDWVVDRCGKKIEYIIDFYAGKPNPASPQIPSFYLDVRPKLSVDGAWMRFQRFIGLN
ncbi:cytochrome c/c1 heme-lyase [Lipomyces japonicus]|uniref:cytochrome c/c1 heme-lyase n=1 Tax=Lipomyces japonicus TaxID=56871 RepID=UPI0034CE1996